MKVWDRVEYVWKDIDDCWQYSLYKWMKGIVKFVTLNSSPYIIEWDGSKNINMLSENDLKLLEPKKQNNEQ